MHIKFGYICTIKIKFNTTTAEAENVGCQSKEVKWGEKSKNGREAGAKLELQQFADSKSTFDASRNLWDETKRILDVDNFTQNLESLFLRLKIKFK